MPQAVGLAHVGRSHRHHLYNRPAFEPTNCNSSDLSELNCCCHAGMLAEVPLCSCSMCRKLQILVKTQDPAVLQMHRTVR